MDTHSCVAVFGALTRLIWKNPSIVNPGINSPVTVLVVGLAHSWHKLWVPSAVLFCLTSTVFLGTWMLNSFKGHAFFSLALPVSLASNVPVCLRPSRWQILCLCERCSYTASLFRVYSLVGFEFMVFSSEDFYQQRVSFQTCGLYVFCCFYVSGSEFNVYLNVFLKPVLVQLEGLWSLMKRECCDSGFCKKETWSWIKYIIKWFICPYFHWFSGIWSRCHPGYSLSNES